MNLLRYFRKRKSISPVGKKAPHRSRPGVEVLEDRCVPSASPFGRLNAAPEPNAAPIKLGHIYLAVDNEPVRMLLPAVQKVREAAQRATAANGTQSLQNGISTAQAQNNLKQIGIATDPIQTREHILLARQVGVAAVDAIFATDKLASPTPDPVGLLPPGILKPILAAQGEPAAGHVRVFDGAKIYLALDSRPGSGVLKSTASNPGWGSWEVSPTEPDYILIGLLVPAVQKVRSAAGQSRATQGRSLFIISFGGNNQGQAQVPVPDLNKIGRGELLHKAGTGQLILPGATGFNLTKEPTGSLLRANAQPAHVVAFAGSLQIGPDGTTAIIAILVGM